MQSRQTRTVPKTVNGPRVERWRVGPAHSHAPSTDYTVLAMIPPQRDQRSPDLASATPLARAVPVNGASYGPTTAPVTPPPPPRARPRAPPGASATASETPRRAAAALRSKGPEPLPTRHAHARDSVGTETPGGAAGSTQACGWPARVPGGGPPSPNVRLDSRHQHKCARGQPPSPLPTTHHPPFRSACVPPLFFFFFLAVSDSLTATLPALPSRPTKAEGVCSYSLAKNAGRCACVRVRTRSAAPPPGTCR